MRVRTACAFVALVFAAAGCGAGASSSTTTAATRTVAAAPSTANDTYVTRMRKLGVTLSTAITLASQTNSATAPATDAANLVRVQRALIHAAAALAAITPPSNVRADHALLLKGVREYASELNGVIRRVRRGQVAALHSIPNLRGLHDMKRGSDAILAKGYAIVP
ncbi:MAG: hypothetical protein QOE43_2276 [Gaiellaceae bacterium]|nr:hypothetical protein [Gaiellaceae bacterium]